MKQIQNSLEILTPAQNEIADFVVNNQEAVAFMTARQLAAAVGQSDAAVVRFSKAVGFQGYSQLKDALRDDLLATHGISGMMAKSSADSHQREARLRVAEVSNELIGKTVERNSANAFNLVIDRLIAARKIYVSGHGTSYPLAAYLSMHLNQCFDKVQLFNVENGDLAERFRTVGPDVVFIGIGYVRYLPYTIELMQFAKRAGSVVVAITDKPTSPLARTADHTLIAERSESSVWWSQAGTLAIADTLISMSIEAEQHSADHLRRSDEMLKQLGHWDTPNTPNRLRSR
jgi:DNA-binding MurR/RpiR family transcriptional regulator